MTCATSNEKSVQYLIDSSSMNFAFKIRSFQNVEETLVKAQHAQSGPYTERPSEVTNQLFDRRARHFLNHAFLLRLVIHLEQTQLPRFIFAEIQPGAVECSVQVGGECLNFLRSWKNCRRYSRFDCIVFASFLAIGHAFH